MPSPAAPYLKTRFSAPSGQTHHCPNYKSGKRGRRPHRARDNSRQRRGRWAEKAGVNGCRFRVRARHRDEGNMDEKLILAVFHYPELYNASVPKYRCAESRASAWKNISSVVGLPCEWRSWKHNFSLSVSALQS